MKDRSIKKPPRLAIWLLQKAVYQDDREYATGDFVELYQDMLCYGGPFKARLRLWMEVFRSLPGFVNNTVYWSLAMFRNYLKVAARNLARFPGFSLINIIGLAVGVTCCLVIGLWVYHLLSYDRFHAKSGRLFQVLSQSERLPDNPGTPAPLAAALRTDIPEITGSTRIESMGEKLITDGERNFFVNIHAADSAFFQMFSFELVVGRSAEALADLHSAVLTEPLAQRIFGDDNAIGRTLRFDDGREFVVSAVVKPPPANSTIRFNAVVRYEIKEREMLEQTGQEMGWGWYSPPTFVEIGSTVSARELGVKLEHFMATYQGEDYTRLSLLPIGERVRLFANVDRLVYTFGSIALFVLLIAVINFVNLATARSLKRAREVGMRKTVGATRRNIFNQFLGESTLVAALAVALATGLASMGLPQLNSALGTSLSLSLIPSWLLVSGLVGLALALGLLAGAYPALVLAAYRPVKTLSQALRAGRRGRSSRRFLVVSQFVMATILIIGAAIIYRQVGYASSLNPGYDHEGVVIAPLRGDAPRSYSALRDQLLADHRIERVSGCAAPFPHFSWSTGALTWEGYDPQSDLHAYFNGVDYGLIETAGLELVSGRAFSRDIASDANAIMINESLARIMNLESPVGTRITLWGNSGEIIGVLKDFHYRPVTEPIEPLLLAIDTTRVWQVMIRCAPGETEAALDLIREVWDQNLPAYPLEHSFLTDAIGEAYAGESQTGKLVAVFAGLALAVACLGLLGLAAYAAEMRAKEIAVRKVLGASIGSTVLLLSRELLGCVVIANLVAWPVGFLIMHDWLERYAFRISIGADLPTVALAVTLAAALLAAGYQSLRAARANPVERLKHE